MLWVIAYQPSQDEVVELSSQRNDSGMARKHETAGGELSQAKQHRNFLKRVATVTSAILCVGNDRPDVLKRVAG